MVKSSLLSQHKLVDYKHVCANTLINRPPSPPFSEATAEQGRLLELAVRRNDIETVRRMLQEGVHPDTLEDSWSSWTPLSYLLGFQLRKNYEMALLLLEFGADPNAEAVCCGTLVHYMTRFAGETYEIQILQTLLKNGGDPCRRNYSGDRPLDLVSNLSDVRRLEPILFPNGEQCP